MKKNYTLRFDFLTKNICLLFFLSTFLIEGNAQHSLDFDGTDDYAIAALDGTSLTEVTVELWINRDVQPVNKGIFQWASVLNDTNPWILIQENGSNIRVYVNGDYRLFSGSIAAGTWTHVAVTYSSGTWKLYINGNLQDNVNEPVGSNLSGAVNFYLGNGFNGYFNGQIDEARAWSKELTAAEISVLYDKKISNPAAINSCLMAYYQMSDGSGTSLTDNSGNGNTGTLNGGTVWSSSEPTLTSPSVNNCSQLLPVELISFTARRQSENVQLNWQAASETNNQGFEIEHSLDNRTWESIGFVSGEGMTYETQSYSFLHKNPVRGVNYYRLKQMDFDGAFEYSDVVSVEAAVSNELLAVSPNPTQNGEVTLNLPETDFEEANLEIYNSTGILIQTERLYSNQTTVRMSDLPKGIYLFSVKVEGQRLIRRVIIN